jgi:hypothetical protein
LANRDGISPTAEALREIIQQALTITSDGHELTSLALANVQLNAALPAAYHQAAPSILLATDAADLAVSWESGRPAGRQTSFWQVEQHARN